MFKAIIVLSLLATVLSFHVNVKGSSSINTALAVKSKSVPFIEQPPALDGTLPGDVGFDPLYLSSLWADKDWSQQVVPDFWPDASRTPIKTIDWMREAEVKHGRYAMMATLGWVAVDLGVRFPGAGESYTSIPSSLAAHTLAAQNGSLGVLLLFISFFEILSGAAIYDQSKGSGRVSGDFSFDPLGFGKDPKKKERFLTNEIKNGRLAMLAFAGIVTQSALFPDKAFPYY